MGGGAREPRARDGLVGALAAVARVEAVADERLAGGGHARDAGDEVDVEGADDGDDGLLLLCHDGSDGNQE